MVSSESDNGGSRPSGGGGTRGTPGGQPRTQVFRKRDGRILGGVCAGLPRIWGLGTNGLRFAFVLAALLGGIGVVLYIACWLVIPLEGREDGDEPTRTIVVLAWGGGALLAIVVVAALSATATAFGLGWLVFALAAITLAGSLLIQRSALAAACAAAIAALTLPATAVALSSIDIQPQSGSKLEQPATASALERATYTSGFGAMLIDLRHTKLPTSGRLTMHIHAGLRQTIVALPSERCVRVQIKYDVHPLARNLAALLTSRQDMRYDGVLLFGRVFAIDTNQGVANSLGAGRGPTLTIDFISQGGGLVVRDFPDAVAPFEEQNWPGFPVTLEPRPPFDQSPFKSESAKLKRQQLNSWRRRHQVQVADQRLVDKLMEGPCNR